MKITGADLIAVAAESHQYPDESLPEIAFAGRSNVGKSSFINALLGRRSLAKVSGTPGKTRTINFYEVNGAFRIVDLPGYGYARISKSESESWGAMIEGYLLNRPNLRKVALLVDIRHLPTAQDIQMYEFLRYYNLGGFVVATKSDKVSKGQMSARKADIRRELSLGGSDEIFPISSLKRTGLETVLDEIGRIVADEGEVKG